MVSAVTNVQTESLLRSAAYPDEFTFRLLDISRPENVRGWNRVALRLLEILGTQPLDLVVWPEGEHDAAERVVVRAALDLLRVGRALTAAKVLADSAADNSGQRHASTVLQLLALAVLQTRKADVS